jgi:hypothetical protein
MMLQTDVFFNFIEANFDIFKEQDHTSAEAGLRSCTRSTAPTQESIERVLPQYKVREELRNYFDEFHERATGGWKPCDPQLLQAASMPASSRTPVEGSTSYVLSGDRRGDRVASRSDMLADQPAQYASLRFETPKAEVGRRSATTLARTSTTAELHFVKVPDEPYRD